MYKQRKNILAHRFIWELVNGPIPDDLVICHKCDNPPCVLPEHLFCTTQKANIHDAYDKNRMLPAYMLYPSKKGSQHAMSKLKEEDIPKIFAMYEEGLTQRAIGEMFSVSQSAIYKVLHGKRWQHLNLLS